MDIIPYVTKDEAIRAVQLEQALLELPEAAGIIFSSVRPVPHAEGKTSYSIMVGCHPMVEEEAVHLLVDSLLRAQFADVSPFLLVVRRGRGRRQQVLALTDLV